MSVSDWLMLLPCLFIVFHHWWVSASVRQIEEQANFVMDAIRRDSIHREEQRLGIVEMLSDACVMADRVNSKGQAENESISGVHHEQQTRA